MKLLRIYKVIPGKETDLMAWGDRLMSDLHDEALETLKEEGVNYEVMKLFQIGNEWYILAFVNSDYQIKETNMERELNKEHRRIYHGSRDAQIPLRNVYELDTTAA
jgi:hypothetical protein